MFGLPASRLVILSLALLLVSQGARADDESGCSQTLNDIAAPITDPTNFEDPRPYTEVRPIYIYHRIDDDFVNGGGAAQVYAVQLRYAINDRWGIIATKDGYVDLNSDKVLRDEQGWADLSAGFKYAFYRDDYSRDIATVGFRYEAPVGEEEVFQGQGDGAFNPFLSAATGLGPINLMAGTGFRIAADDQDSSFYDFDLHADTKIGPVHPLVELNVISVVDAGSRLPIADEGEDFFNFGASGSDGKTLVSAAVGARVDLTDSLTFGAAFQVPLTNGAGSNILEYRVTTDLIARL